MSSFTTRLSRVTGSAHSRKARPWSLEIVDGPKGPQAGNVTKI
jgi:hypothetical protein